MPGFFSLRCCTRCHLHFADRFTYISHRRRCDREAAEAKFAAAHQNLKNLEAIAAHREVVLEAIALLRESP
jgi:hypothetical protein